MKRKQKKLLMIALGVVAAILCATQLGPILTGAPLVENGKGAKKGAAAVKTAKPKNPASAGRTQTAQAAPARAPARAPAGGQRKPKTESQAPAPPPLTANQIDFSAIGAKQFSLDWASVRDPFGQAPFELASPTETLAMSKLSLKGIVRTTSRRLAIIGNRVYREGQEVIPGVTLVTVDERGVLLSDGEHKVHLLLNANALTFERP